MVVVALSDG
ncbi:unnamed protein product [Lactuca saligna]|uniref:Uncharacterized protein n=1 Tax=Lactuca saligna TaxID=75948 RepID=A0AA35VD07_LACSI|nr:unnamed protein product [Lactuca saligna]